MERREDRVCAGFSVLREPAGIPIPEPGSYTRKVSCLIERGHQYFLSLGVE